MLGRFSRGGFSYHELEEGSRFREFLERFLDTVFPERKEKIGKIREKLNEFLSLRGDSVIPKDLAQVIVDELKDRRILVIEEKGAFLILTEREQHVCLNLLSILEENGGALPEDPIVVVPLEEPVEGCEERVKTLVRTVCDVYVDVIDLLDHSSDIDALMRRDPIFLPVCAAAASVLSLISKIKERGKVNVDELAEIEDGNLKIEFSEKALEGMIDALEDEELVKVKGKRVSARF